MDEVAEVKSRLEITEVVGSYLPLKQAGRNLKAPCPFHQEKSASFMVSPEKGIYHCFGCGEGGDIFNFVMKMEGVSFRESLEMLARKAGVELVAKKGENKEASRMRDRLLEAHALAVKYFQASLVQNTKALEYVIKKRRLTKQTIKNFQIGYAPDSWNALTDFLRSKGFTQQELLQGGLAGQKEGRNTIYDLFRGRVTFTITDREGRPIGFTARVLDDSLPKYLNTPQTPLYDKSQVIFGLFLAKEAIRAKNEVVLVEGNMDVVASHQVGVKQVVAASGTALTSAQLKVLSGLTKKVILAFDSDRAGMAATQRAVPLAQKHGIHLFAMQLKGAKDADELIQKDPALWEDAILNAKEIRDYWLEAGINEFDLNSALGKKQFVERMIEVAALYAETDHNDLNEQSKELTLDQDTFLINVAEKSGIEMATLRNELIKRGAKSLKNNTSESIGSSQTVRRAVVQTENRTPARVKREELFLAINLMYPSVRASLGDLSVDTFTSEGRRQTFEMLTKHPEAAAEDIAAQAGDTATYIKQLLIIGEDEFPTLEAMDAAREAFEFSKIILHDANTEKIEKLSLELKYAEEKGDSAARTAIMQQISSIIDSAR